MLCSVPIGVVISAVTSLIWLYLLPDPHIFFYKEVYAVSLFLCSPFLYMLSLPLLRWAQKWATSSRRLHSTPMWRSSLKAHPSQFAASQTAFSYFFSHLLDSRDSASESLSTRFVSLSCLRICFVFDPRYGLQIYRLLKNPETSSSLPIRSFTEILPSFSLPTDSTKVLLLFFRQSLLKQLLTEGERYILSFSSVSMHDQGIFDIVNNLGSLFARFLFQPLEEGFYLYFSRVFLVFPCHY